MGKMGKFSTKGMKEFQKGIEKLQKQNKQQFIEACAKELAARLLAELIDNTPVGEYPKSTGKKGGTLKRGWNVNYSSGFEIRREGDLYIIELVNPVEYASYVEYGHRTADHKGWVQGRFMLTISEQEIQDIAPKVLEAKIKKFLGECMK